MTIVFWALSGLIIGLLTSLTIRGYGILEDVIVGIVGAIIGGWLVITLIQTPVLDPDPVSILPSLGGAFLFIALSRRITKGRTVI
ncbi:MAG: GlsB/YeaQ/YmgE family stress response membrane protein [Chloroflexota bacterium]|jgi:uncharacterized membrane protein YeaQ/YmgE (transglycosylase-associated protein family)